MLQELQTAEFNRAWPILDGHRVNMEIKAIVTGNSPGWVFVDQKDKPQTALVFSHGQDGFYFVGREDNPVFIEAIFPTFDALSSSMIFKFPVTGPAPIRRIVMDCKT